MTVNKQHNKRCNLCISEKEFSNWGSLKLNSVDKTNAAKTLFEIIFLVTGMSKKSAAEVINMPISQCRLDMFNLPYVVSFLRTNGYWFGKEKNYKKTMFYKVHVYI